LSGQMPMSTIAVNIEVTSDMVWVVCIGHRSQRFGREDPRSSPILRDARIVDT
jgi:hypothetical protein